MTGAKTPVWERDEPDSPCQAICMIDPATRLCIGCKRTIDEISAWPRMSAEERRIVWGELASRNVGHPKRKGGRASRIAQRKDPPPDT